MKSKGKSMMNAEEETYQRQRKCWLGYGRALLTIAILGLFTVALYAVTKSDSSKDEHDSRVIVIAGPGSPSGSSREEIVEKITNGDAASDQLDQRRVFRRSVDQRQNNIEGNSIEVPRDFDNSVQSFSDVNSDKRMDSQHLKMFRRQGSNQNPEHRHSDGDIYFFQGYKCVPIRKPPKQLAHLRAEPIRARPKSGRLRYFLLTPHGSRSFRL